MAFNPEIVILDDNESASVQARREHASGMQLLGDGLYSQVFGHADTPYAVKIVRAVDRGYMAYLNVISALGHDCPYVPKIIRVVHYRFRDSYYEKYRHLEYDWVEPGLTKHDRFVVYMEKLEQPARYSDSGSPMAVQSFVSTLKSFVNNALVGGTKWHSLRPKHRDLITLLLIAYEMQGAGEDYVFDLHGGNVMKRGQQYVVTDPLA